MSKKNMLLYNSKILFVNYLEVQFLTHIEFQEDLKILTVDELKGEFFNFFNEMVNRKCRYLYFSVHQVEHLIDEDFIMWFNRVILPEIVSQKAKKIGWLYRPDKQLPQIDKQATETIEQQVFTNPAELMKWLLDGAERKKLSDNHSSCSH